MTKISSPQADEDLGFFGRICFHEILVGDGAFVGLSSWYLLSIEIVSYESMNNYFMYNGLCLNTQTSNKTRDKLSIGAKQLTDKERERQSNRQIAGIRQIRHTHSHKRK